MGVLTTAFYLPPPITLSPFLPVSVCVCVCVAQRKCCPQIASNLTTISIERDLLVHLHLSVNPGNCSLNEGFRYRYNNSQGSESLLMQHWD